MISLILRLVYFMFQVFLFYSVSGYYVSICVSFCVRVFVCVLLLIVMPVIDRL